MTQHTPGPWNHDLFRVVNNEGEIIADCDNSHELTSHEIVANARLIAAAPEMFAALLEAEVLLDQYPTVRQMVKQALAKAEGGTK